MLRVDRRVRREPSRVRGGVEGVQRESPRAAGTAQAGGRRGGIRGIAPAAAAAQAARGCAVHHVARVRDHVHVHGLRGTPTRCR